MRRLVVIILIVGIGVSESHAIDFPNDLPTIEALISLHKLIKADEDDAM